MEKKRNLIAKYKAEGGIKNLAWVTTYVEKAKDLEITDNHVKKGFMLASEILKLNGFAPGQFDSKTEEKILQGLLKDCYQQFGIDQQNPEFALKQEHPEVPQLNKFWYMKLLQSTTDRNVFESSMDLQMDLQSSGLNKALSSGASSSTGEGVVKVENQPLLDLKQELTIVQSMKTSVEKEFQKAETLWKDLKAEDKDECRVVLTNMEPVFTEVNTFLQKIRKLMVDCKAFDTASEQTQLKSKIQELKGAIDVGTHHIDGLKSLCKRLRALQ